MDTNERKYRILLKTLDRIIEEAATSSKRLIFREAQSDASKRDAARARAYIHLYLQAARGLHDFDDRESLITDGPHDGGIDAYFIDEGSKVIEFVQSKFRTTGPNFKEKFISIEEISKIDAERISRGETHGADGNKYNGHINRLQRQMFALPGISRYRIRVVILANVKPSQQHATSKILDNYETDIFNFERCYNELILPVLRGEQSYSAELNIHLDLSNKPTSSMLSAKINTAYGQSDVSVVLAPTLEIAKIMSRYRNSILRYNPRSYLEFRDQQTNDAIRKSITEKRHGEFAILNNGITILSDDTYFSDRIGRKDLAQLTLVNPQIINGGQTAFTLSRIYDEASDIERLALFSDKEVIVRIVTLPETDRESRMALIQEVSEAANSQTHVSTVDRELSNDDHRELAQRAFTKLGILYEYRRGEYSDAMHKGIIDQELVIERSLFLRLLFLAQGKYERAAQRRVTKKGKLLDAAAVGDDTIHRLGQVYDAFRAVWRNRSNLTLAEVLAQVQAAIIAEREGLLGHGTSLESGAVMIQDRWSGILFWVASRSAQRRGRPLPEGLDRQLRKSLVSWPKSSRYTQDLKEYFHYYGLSYVPTDVPAQLPPLTAEEEMRIQISRKSLGVRSLSTSKHR